MSKKSKMRWSESDRRELQRAVKNFNSKIAYHQEKNDYTAFHLPRKTSVKEQLENIETRADYNRIINSLRRFQKRGAEAPVKSSKGALLSQWDVDEFKIKQRIVNAERTRRRKELEGQTVKVGGEPTENKRAEMGRVTENAVKPSRKNPENMSLKEFKKATEYFDRMINSKARREHDEQIRENYIKGLTNMGYLDKNQKLEEYIRGVDLDTFFNIMDTDETGTFNFMYDKQEFDVRAEYINSTWETAYNNKNKGG